MTARLAYSLLLRSQSTVAAMEVQVFASPNGVVVMQVSIWGAAYDGYVLRLFGPFGYCSSRVAL